MGAERIREAIADVKWRRSGEWGKDFLYDYQKKAIEELEERGNSALILQGGVGCGKSRTGLYWYFKANGGLINGEQYEPMIFPKDLYIITTAHKRDTMDWEFEMIPFGIVVRRKNVKGTATLGGTTSDGEAKIKSLLYPKLNVVIDSWQNIGKYADVENAYFIFDEDHVVSFGAWTKAFIQIAQGRGNKWIVMTATPADQWIEYGPVFVACGFYKNKSDFVRQHLVYDPYVTKFPKIKGYMNVGRLIKFRNRITVKINYKHDIDSYDYPILCDYDVAKYNYIMQERFDPWKEEPIKNAGGLCYCLRKACNESTDRIEKLIDILKEHKRVIVFYNHDYELEMLKNFDWASELGWNAEDFELAELNGHRHEVLPSGDKWLYLCQYSSGAEAWNCITTNVIVFFSQTYSYKMLIQAKGRIDRQNTPYRELHYYHLLSRSPIDISIKKTLGRKQKFNEGRYLKELGVEFA